MNNPVPGTFALPFRPKCAADQRHPLTPRVMGAHEIRHANLARGRAESADVRETIGLPQHRKCAGDR